MVKNAKWLWIVLGVIAAGTQVQATMLNAGGYVPGPIDTLTSVPTGSVLADTGVKSFVGVAVNSPTPFQGSYESWVIKDSSTGNLDFVYKVTNSATSRDELHRLTMTDFTNFKTDVYALTSSAVSPISVDRANTGAVVGFQYSLVPGQGIGQGTSVEVVIKTNANAFTLGNLSVIDGGVANVSAYAPSTGGGHPNPTPVPGAGILLGTGLLSLAGHSFWRRKQALAA